MAGKFSKNAIPKRPGAYFNFVTREPEPRLENSLGIVVVPFSHSWGPENAVVELNSFSDFLSIYGQGGTAATPTYSVGYRAVHDAFRGEGVQGYGGAGKVLAYRMVASGGAKATKALNNTTPVAAITLSARYKGSYGNNLSFAVVADAVDSSTHANLVIYVEAVEVERYKYAKTDITNLAAQVNASSDWVTAGSVTSGVALTTVSSPTAATGGDDGSTLTSTEWTALMSAVDPYRFTIFAATDLVDTSIQASIKTWAVGLNDHGKRFMSVVGGVADESYADAIDATGGASQFNDPNFIRIGIGSVTDDKFGDLSTAQLVPRIAGILAQRGEAMSMTFARLAGLSIKTGASDSDILRSIDNGVITIGRDSHPTAPVRLEKAVTTYVTTDGDRPVEIYSVPKYVRTMHGIETELTEFAEINVIGNLPVNNGTRDYLRGQMAARMESRALAGVIQSGWTVTIDSDPAPSDSDDFIALLYEIGFGRSLEKVLNTVVVG